MKFEWDLEKAQVNLNLKKHGISFNEAQTVFDDPLVFLMMNGTQLVN